MPALAARMTTRSSASCRGSSARSSSTSASSSPARRAASSRRASSSTRRACSRSTRRSTSTRVRAHLDGDPAICAGGADGGPDRRAAAARALPLAGRAAQHDASRPRPCTPAAATTSTPRSSTCSSRMVRPPSPSGAFAMNEPSVADATPRGADLPFRPIAELRPRARARRAARSRRSSTTTRHARLRRARRADGPRRRVPAARRRRAPGEAIAICAATRRATRRSSSARCAPASSSRRSPPSVDAGELSRRCSPTRRRACSSSMPQRSTRSAAAPTAERCRRASRSTARRAPAPPFDAWLAAARAARRSRSTIRPEMAVQHHLFVGHDRHAEGHRPAARHALVARDARRPLRLRRATR